MSSTTAAPQSSLGSRTMILGAGFGSRMDPLTRERPKPFLPVGDGPLLAKIAGVLLGLGERHAVINAHWMKDYFSSNISNLHISFNVSYESSILGVAGGIAAARPLLEAPVATWNGDIWLQHPPLQELRDVAARAGSICLAVAPAEGEGTVGLDALGRVVRLRGEQYGTEVRSANYIGLCGLSEPSLQRMPAQGCLIGDYCMPQLRSGAMIETLCVKEPWYDIGSRKGYLAANLAWLRQHHPNEEKFVHPSAQVGPAVRVERSLVGQGAVVQGSGLLRECIIWPGARAVAPLTRCVVTPKRVVPIDEPV